MPPGRVPHERSACAQLLPLQPIALHCIARPPDVLPFEYVESTAARVCTILWCYGALPSGRVPHKQMARVQLPLPQAKRCASRLRHRTLSPTLGRCQSTVGTLCQGTIHLVKCHKQLPSCN